MKNRDWFFILVRKENTNYHIKINNSDLLYVQAQGDYVHVQTRAEKYLIHSTLKDFTERLQHILYRCHRSYSINIDNVEIVNNLDVFVGKYEVPIGEEFKKPLMNILYNNK